VTLLVAIRGSYSGRCVGESHQILEQHEKKNRKQILSAVVFIASLLTKNPINAPNLFNESKLYCRCIFSIF